MTALSLVSQASMLHTKTANKNRELHIIRTGGTIDQILDMNTEALGYHRKYQPVIDTLSHIIPSAEVDIVDHFVCGKNSDAINNDDIRRVLDIVRDLRHKSMILTS
jgi:L-asparaginase/Glu-tRNA(Gln) amidotransferase subunit D